ncbi:MAG: DUF5693 family protein [Candidatus Margulisbacteria bacterium]|nr:DUF5693 family protein [Candidatus Margulisiibacteriota bacterium]
MFDKKTLLKISPLLLVLFFASLVPMYQRSLWDSRNKTVEVVYSYDAIDKIYLLTGFNTLDLIKNFKLAGLSSIVLKEETLRQLADAAKLTYIKGSDLINNNRIVQRANTIIYSRLPRDYTVQPAYIYIIVDENSTFDYVKRSLEIKLGEQRVRDLGLNVLEVVADSKELLDLPLDINTDKAGQLNEMGIDVMPAFVNFSVFTEENLAYKISRLQDYSLNTILFTGDEVMGYPDYLPTLLYKLDEINKNYGLVELFTGSQKGRQGLALKSSKKAIKVHYIEMLKNNDQIYLNQALRAVQERNCRILYIEPYVASGQVNAYAYNSSFLKRLRENLERKGYHVGVIKDNPYKKFIHSPFTYLSYLTVFIIILGFIRIFLFGLEKKWIRLFLILYVLGIFVLLFTGHEYLLNKIQALLVAIISPVILFAWIEHLLKSSSKIPDYRQYATILFLLFSGSLFAGITIQNLLFDPNYFWNIWGFKGVKLAVFTPVILLLIYFFVKPERIQYLYFSVRRFLSKQLTVLFLVGAVLFIIFSFFYIFRTGNTGILVFGDYELRFRELLEQIFIVRPRTKEILFGYPLLILAIYFWNNPRVKQSIKYLMLTFASVASISMINTFCHIHSPIFISFYRSVMGLVLGTIIGFILVFLCNFYFQIKKKGQNP